MTKSILEQVSCLRKVDHLHLLQINPKLLDNRRSIKVMVCIDNHCFKTFAYRRETIAECVIPFSIVERLHLQTDQLVEFTIRTLLLKKESSIPNDLQAALDKEGLEISLLPEKQRWQLIMMVKESSHNEIRKMRIEAILSACKKLAE